MRRFFIALCLLPMCGLLSRGETINALRFEGLWKLNAPDVLKAKLEFQVNGESVSAAYFHPFPSTLSNIQIDRDRFTGWFLDEFASKVYVTGQLRGNELQLAMAPEGRPPLIYSGSRIAPEVSKGTHQTFTGSFNQTGKSASAEFTVGDRHFVFSGGLEDNCFSGSYGKDGKGAAVNGCVSVSKHP